MNLILLLEINITIRVGYGNHSESEEPDGEVSVLLFVPSSGSRASGGDSDISGMLKKQ